MVQELPKISRSVSKAYEAFNIGPRKKTKGYMRQFNDAIPGRPSGLSERWVLTTALDCPDCHPAQADAERRLSRRCLMNSQMIGTTLAPTTSNRMSSMLSFTNSKFPRK